MPTTSDSWEQFKENVFHFKKAITHSKTVNVNANPLKLLAKNIAQQYFRECRPILIEMGFIDDALNILDSHVQTLLKLSNGNNPRSYYIKSLKIIFTQQNELELFREKKMGMMSNLKFNFSEHENKILITLKEIIPSAAASYEQACLDLADVKKISFRGTANELRECVREVLDHLAPDREVFKSPNFQLEADRKTPTMKQKVRFILKMRGLPLTALETPEHALSCMDEAIAKLTRSIYERSSVSTHLANTKAEILQMKMYVDSVLAELLAIHSNAGKGAGSSCVKSKY